MTMDSSVHEGEIVFLEEVLEDGRILIRWEAAKPRDWKRILELIKNGIPTQARKFIPETKQWLIAASHRSAYENIKGAILSRDAEAVAEIDNGLNGEVLASLLDNSIRGLPPSMKRRAIYAIKATLGLIDAPVEFCVSERRFAAWSEDEQNWLFEDGHYSSISPSERDRRAITEAYKRLEEAVKSLPDAFDYLDSDRPDYWKIVFRRETLERYNFECYTCGATPRDLTKLHMHRVIPGHSGGMYTEDNVVLVCSSCHPKVEGLSWEDTHAVREYRMEADQS